MKLPVPPKTTCNKCGISGHFACCCNMKSEQTTQNSRFTRQKRNDYGQNENIKFQNENLFHIQNLFTQNKKSTPNKKVI